VAAGIGSNEQGEYCRAALQRSDRKEPRYKWPTLLFTFTPNYLTLGREVRAPIDIVYGSPETTLKCTYDDYVDELQHRLQGAYTHVREQLQEAAQRSKRYYDTRVRPQQCSLGDWVYYYNPRKHVGRQDKWSRKFSGPFLVVAVLLLYYTRPYIR